MTREHVQLARLRGPACRVVKCYRGPLRSASVIRPAPWRPELRDRVLLLSLAFLATPTPTFSPVYAQAPARLVKDINATPVIASSDPANFVRLGAQTYFLASTPEAGRELWRTDGSDAGTKLLADLEPGPWEQDTRALTVLGNRLYVLQQRSSRTDDETVDTVLWKSDATEAGTTVLSEMSGHIPATETPLVAAGGRLFFPTVDSAAGEISIWVSDGSPGGLRRLHVAPRLFPDPDPGITALRNAVLFFAPSMGQGYGLWRSDGTVNGTRLLKGGYDQGPERLTRIGNEVFFVETDFELRTALWKSDGTAAGTVPVRDGFDLFSPPAELTEYAADLFFAAGDSVTQKFGLWRSDGTEDGTVLFAEPSALPFNLTAIDGLLYFAAYTSEPYRLQIWTSNGTTVGTRVLLEAETGIYPRLTDLSDRLLFTFPSEASPVALWTSDGTLQGTEVLRDISPGADPRVQFEPGVTPRFFSANDGTTGGELWTTDGTTEGTRLVRNIAADDVQTPRADVRGLTRAGQLVFFTASDRLVDDRFTSELWKTDGTSSGTVKLTNLNGGSARSRPLAGLRAVGDRVFFAFGTALWVSDGTPGGTVSLNGRPAPGEPVATDLTPAGDLLFYVKSDSERILCRSDGSVAGTRCLPEATPRDLQQLVAAGDRLFLVAGFPLRSLWVVTDGEHAQPLHQISALISPTTLGDGLIFFNSDELHGSELWRSDGTPEGTELVADIRPGRDSSAGLDQRMVELNGYVYFRADDGVHGWELWRTDGTAAGTGLVADLVPGPDSSAPFLARAGGRLFIFAHDELGAPQSLWVYDDATGERRRLGAVSLPGVRQASDFADANGTLTFTSCDDHGCEPWGSDGTPQGTRRLADIAAGVARSFPGFYAPLGTQLLLAADDGVHGSELWAIPLPLTDVCIGDCRGDGSVSIDELVTAVSIALGHGPVEACLTIDRNADGAAGIDELVAAVGSALAGCAPSD